MQRLRPKTPQAQSSPWEEPKEERALGPVPFMALCCWLLGGPQSQAAGILAYGERVHLPIQPPWQSPRQAAEHRAGTRRLRPQGMRGPRKEATSSPAHTALPPIVI